MSDPAQPLILTLAMDDAAFQRLDALRQQHFPPERNFIPAHVTLFHHLPGDELAGICRTLAALCRDTSPFDVETAGLQFLGRGVAIRLTGSGLLAFRASLAQAWTGWLTPQDRQPWRPHVTIQNKVHPEEARRLHEELRQTFRSFRITASGLLLWRYLGGPWMPSGSFVFGGSGPGSEPPGVCAARHQH